ncbi:ubiquinol-cytochrome c reductase iron-sulfur subunit N-terminal domain-containing protein [Halomonas sp. NPDC076908]|nr:MULTISPECIES: ubiquinol-cytochrome c reductase iron-sulfur subunit N-terminal domain-containing protein [unclassified Halomonas]KUJ86451.1 MAG: hypothetical protein XD36_3117 [Halomonas sp. 54_146]HAA44015.1 hypothetical protein [Halomonas sp.]
MKRRRFVVSASVVIGSVGTAFAAVPSISLLATQCARHDTGFHIAGMVFH